MLGWLDGPLSFKRTNPSMGFQEIKRRSHLVFTRMEKYSRLTLSRNILKRKDCEMASCGLRHWNLNAIKQTKFLDFYSPPVSENFLQPTFMQLSRSTTTLTIHHKRASFFAISSIYTFLNVDSHSRIQVAPCLMNKFKRRRNALPIVYDRSSC